MELSLLAVRVRRLILANTALTVFAAATLLVVWWLWIPRTDLLVLTGCVAVAAGVMAQGLRPLARDRVGPAIGWWSGANWGIALVAAGTASFCWPQMLMTSLLPAVLAAATTSGRQVRVSIVVSIAVATLVSLLGVSQDLTGLTEATPVVVQQALLLGFTPAAAALLGLIVVGSSLEFRSALDAAVTAQHELAAQAEELRLSRARVVAATDRERQRIERDLHDGAQQRLISIGIGLASASRLTGSDPAAATALLHDLRAQLRVAHDEVRSLAQGVYPPVLVEHGLAEALRSAVDRYPLRIVLDLDDPGRLRSEVEATVYFCCQEALQNAAKHSRAHTVRLGLGRTAEAVWFEVADDGVGFASATAAPSSGGLVNLRDRIGASGGDLAVSSRPGGGTRVRGEVPLV